MQEAWLQALGWEDPLEKGMATHSSILAWEIPRTEELGELCYGYTLTLYSKSIIIPKLPWSSKESDTTDQLELKFSFLSTFIYIFACAGSSLLCIDFL